ncbi:unnamed protein product [Phyllotreta striolata]|uniref:Uncharacterized protein n=1 Tax=Phyllotreta striolata TaxID=444603 RepID=A0A9N9TFP6_PHYSR|nr:unnamed protein product [Phyllotreta striolata]
MYMEEEQSDSSQSITLGNFSFSENEYNKFMQLTQEIDESFAKEKARKLREKERRQQKKKEKLLQKQKIHETISTDETSLSQQLDIYDASDLVKRNLASQASVSLENPRRSASKDDSKQELHHPKLSIPISTVEVMQHFRKLSQEVDEFIAKEKTKNAQRNLRDKERREQKKKEKQLQKTKEISSITASSSIDQLGVYDASGTATGNLASQRCPSTSKNSCKTPTNKASKNKQSKSNEMEQHLQKLSQEINDYFSQKKARLLNEENELPKGRKRRLTSETNLDEKLEMYEISGRIMKKLVSEESTISQKKAYNTRSHSRNKENASNRIRQICREVSENIEQFISQESIENIKLKKANIKTRSTTKKIREQENVKERFINYITPKLYEKMCRIHEDRNVGLYVICDICDKSRYLPDVVDPLDIPDMWYCFMNPDENFNNCARDEVIDEDEDYLIQNSYNAGSIVIAKHYKLPWWPGMVEDDPDIEDYYRLKDTMVPTHYHVTFFDSGKSSRAWVKAANIKPFKANMGNPIYQPPANGRDSVHLKGAFEKARQAISMPLLQRLRKYSIIHSLLIREASTSKKSKKTVAIKKAGRK